MRARKWHNGQSGNCRQKTTAFCRSFRNPGKRAELNLLPNRCRNCHRFITAPRWEIEFAFFPANKNVGINVDTHYSFADELLRSLPLFVLDLPALVCGWH